MKFNEFFSPLISFRLGALWALSSEILQEMANENATDLSERDQALIRDIKRSLKLVRDSVNAFYARSREES